MNYEIQLNPIAPIVSSSERHRNSIIKGLWTLYTVTFRPQHAPPVYLHKNATDTGISYP